MNCFQLIKLILDEAFEDIEGTEEEKYSKIKSSLTYLSNHYKRLSTSVAGVIDYQDPATRFAYLYRYTTSHANIVYEVLRSFTKANEILNVSELNISCIGGGPGSDFIGILKYCIKSGISPRLRCRILDKDATWSETWEDVDKKLSGSFSLNAYYTPLDVCDEETYKKYAKYLNSDIFTLVYFMSEVYSKKSESESFFKHFFVNAKIGSTIIFIDNNTPCFYEWFDELSDEAGFTIEKAKELKMNLPIEEEKKDLGEYYRELPDPKIQADIAYRVAVKKL